MPIALPPADEGLRVPAALLEEGDDAIGELAEGHRIEGRGVEPVDDERAVTADPFEAFPRRAFRGGLGGVQGERRLLDFFADEGILLRSFVIEDRGVESRDDWSRLR
jgi:hypothetical protein